MLVGSILLITLGGVVGIVMLTLVLKGRPIAPALPVAHGVLAGPGVLLALLVALRDDPYPLLCFALGAFALAALGGIYLVSLHLRQKKFPLPAVFIHGAVGVTGLVLLIIYAAC